MANVSSKKNRQSPVSSSRSSGSSQRNRPAILGIWRLGDVLHSGSTTELAFAQPADAAGSPRWDYVIKRALSGQDSEARRQIGQYVAAASATADPNLVPVLDASATASSPYLVMPRLEGSSMHEQMTTAPAKPLPVALWLVRQVAQALDSLHASGWIHGDIKPANVMVGSRGHVTLIDLGFAARIHTAPNHQYRGTPDFSSPESMAGDMAAIAAMDMFSLGRVLWQWLTLTEPVNQSVLEPVADLVQSLVSDDPVQRPAASEVVKQLLRLEIETLGRHIGPSRRAA
ncbi:MAG: protein kinase family protein [Rubripirellula sp.]